MSVLDWIVSIVLFIVSLGVLIIIHELGHLSMAKLFKVYCQEFSIGFGPAIIHKKPKGKETYISLRAIPFGGFVSMYGEDGQELEDDLKLPPERSLEGIKKWKKAIILVAGVTLNAVLALLLIGVSNICFPLIRATTTATIKESSIAASVGISEGDTLQLHSCVYVGEDGNKYKASTVAYSYILDNKQYMGYYTMIDNDIEIDGRHYVWTYYPNGNKYETNFTDGGHLYPANTVEEVKADEDKARVYAHWLDEGKLSYYPNFKVEPYKPYDSTTEFTAKLTFITANKAEKHVNLPMKTIQNPNQPDSYIWRDVGMSFKLVNEWLPFGDRIKNTFVEFGDASITVFKGLGMLFTGGIQNMSGIVGVLQTSANVYGTYSFSYYLYFWGMISVNLAIFNLLPFPGLDGFQLCITIIEGISKKRVPSKFKSIMSVIGLLLLFGLMTVVIIFDILRWAGVAL